VDIADLEDTGLPVYARGVIHLGPYKDGPGQIGGPIALSGTPGLSGDVVVGDEDGVAVVPAGRVAEVAPAVTAVTVAEGKAVADIDNGRWDWSWIDRALTVVDAS
jgi:regulator of RNase E activity RraA